MLYPILSGILLVAMTVVIHAVGTTGWIVLLVHRYGREGNLPPRTAIVVMTWTVVVLLLLHVSQCLLWALAYLLLEPVAEITTFEEALYFSLVTFTTLGYGDITLPESRWRVVSGIQALNGIVLLGWSTALLFTVVQRSWERTGTVRGRH